MEINKDHLAYIELMARNMTEHLHEAIHEYVAIHKINHKAIGVISIPFVVDRLNETDDGATTAAAHTLLVSTAHRENVVNMLMGMVEKIKSGAAPLHDYFAPKPTDG